MVGAVERRQCRTAEAEKCRLAQPPTKIMAAMAVTEIIVMRTPTARTTRLVTAPMMKEVTASRSRDRYPAGAIVGSGVARERANLHGTTRTHEPGNNRQQLPLVIADLHPGHITKRPGPGSNRQATPYGAQLPRSAAWSRTSSARVNLRIF